MHRAIFDRGDALRRIAGHSGLRFIRSGSGPLDPKVLLGLEDAFGVPVLDGYSVSEAGVVTYNPLPPAVRKPGTVGIPLSSEVTIVDERGNALGPRRVGEIVVRGPLVSDGYWGDSAPNAAAFVDGAFFTGDLGWFDEDGYLTLTGRIDDTINRGGEKIAPAEVEAALAAHPSVREVCVFPVPHPTLGQEVAVAVVPARRGEFDEGEFVAFANRRLAAFKVPRKIVMLDSLPKTATGKIRRSAVANALGRGDAAQLRPDVPDRRARPPTPVEAALAGLWALTLGLDKVGFEDDFFLLGGDSLRATRLLGQVQAVFGTDIPVADVFNRASTVAGMARCIEISRRSPASDEAAVVRGGSASAIPRRDPSVPCPLSYQQQRLWFIDRLQPGNPVYHVSQAISMIGPLDAAALGRAINGVVARHDALRTNFVTLHGEPHQVVAPRLEIPVPVRDIGDLPSEHQTALARRVASTVRLRAGSAASRRDIEARGQRARVASRPASHRHRRLVARHLQPRACGVL
jgi:hypothetical protein